MRSPDLTDAFPTRLPTTTATGRRGVAALATPVAAALAALLATLLAIAPAAPAQTPPKFPGLGGLPAFG